MSLLERVQAAKEGQTVPTESPSPNAVVPTTPPAPTTPAENEQPEPSYRVSAREQNFRRIRTRIEEAVADSLAHLIDLSDPEGVRSKMAGEIDAFVGDYIIDNDLNLTRDERRRLVQGVIDEVAGFGPIEPLLSDPTITEVLVHGP